MPKQVRALKRVYYAGREYNPGEVFFTQADTDAEAMTLVGSAEYFKEEPKAKAAPEAAAAPEAQADENVLPERTPMPRKYARRDMRAED